MSRKRRRRGNRRPDGSGNRSRTSPPQEKTPQRALPVFTCSHCGDAIADVLQAIAHPDTGDPIHFECAVSLIKEREQLREGEEICYLGGGSFGIVLRKSPPSPVRFFVRKRIEFEPQERKDWRKQLHLSP
ncbi:hypothetical protein [Spirochaeta thermophila]|uniref:Uncharacterized protein n=1 Tax=Winmispira thermophila (strain ATCC 49972 / DSM 6192 / RI 19.B1) TaxID=665571 RepID=E0RSM0_WINT6|nr:hypothetical protein [Spirochaeta thermophila]ADN02007.1 hypothetical protein STHERM_c10620 [Spirochaeta thermophila DSM 6192]